MQVLISIFFLVSLFTIPVPYALFDFHLFQVSLSSMQFLSSLLISFYLDLSSFFSTPSLPSSFALSLSVPPFFILMSLISIFSCPFFACGVCCFTTIWGLGWIVISLSRLSTCLCPLVCNFRADQTFARSWTCTDTSSWLDGDESRRECFWVETSNIEGMFKSSWIKCWCLF